MAKNHGGPDFDEALIAPKHIQSAINRYCRERPKHRPARSAFLPWKGEKLPAKCIMKMAFEEATGHFPDSEKLTGGRASVRLLRERGFDAVYEKAPGSGGNRNKVKSLRREAFRQILAGHWGETVLEEKFPGIRVPDLADRSGLSREKRRLLEAVESLRGQTVRGRKGYRLQFDFYLKEHRLAIEFDERQHFTPARAAILQVYPDDIPLGFDRERWIALSEEIRAGDNSPPYRDEQRAFYDALRDVEAPRNGLRPVVRVFEEDVLWEKTGESNPEAQRILGEIEALLNRR